MFLIQLVHRYRPILFYTVTVTFFYIFTYNSFLKNIFPNENLITGNSKKYHIFSTENSTFNLTSDRGIVFRYRNELLGNVCEKYNDPFRPEYQSLHTKPKGPGSEVVLIPGDPPAVVCIPHKVSSHAWGEFSRVLEKKFPERMARLRMMNWTERARAAQRLVVVRHPLERLVSAYRMIFQDWCNQNKFIRQQWSSICSEEALSGKDKSSNLWKKLVNLQKDPSTRLGILNVRTNGINRETSQERHDRNVDHQDGDRINKAKTSVNITSVDKTSVDRTSVNKTRVKKANDERTNANGKRDDSLEGLPGLLSALYDEHIHGADRYVGHIWDKYHPEEESHNNQKYKFSMKEFVRFLVNATHEFADDQYVLQHSLLSYHWAPYWSECPLCGLQPQYILHMETFGEDLDAFLADVGLLQYKNLFPHTHTQQGGHSSKVAEKFLEELNQEELDQLYEKYQLDHELFGYSVETV